MSRQDRPFPETREMYSLSYLQYQPFPVLISLRLQWRFLRTAKRSSIAIKICDLWLSRHPGCSFSLARAAWANFSASCSSSSLRVSSTLPHTSSLSCPLITSSFRCTIFSDIVFEWCVATSFYQCSVNHVSFCFANLPLLYFNFQPISIYFILNGK